jgi:hypothetical protein
MGMSDRVSLVDCEAMMMHYPFLVARLLRVCVDGCAVERQLLPPLCIIIST